MSHNDALELIFDIIALCVVLFTAFCLWQSDCSKNRHISYDQLICQYKLKEMAGGNYVNVTPSEVSFCYEQNTTINTKCVDRENVFIEKSDKNIIQIYKGKCTISNSILFNGDKEITVYKICTNKPVNMDGNKYRHYSLGSNNN